MPIRFRCVYCGQLLSIATRKVGKSVDCPKCSHPNVVPEKDQVADEKKPSSTEKVAKAFESKKFDKWLGRDMPKEEEKESSRAAGDSAEVEAVSNSSDHAHTGSDSASAVEEPWKREPESLPEGRSQETAESVSITAGAAIPLAILVVVLLLVAFGLGVIVGRYAWPVSSADETKTESKVRSAQANNARKPPTPEAALLAEAALAHQASRFNGKITFTPAGATKPTPDAGAIIIALPSKTRPAADRKIPATGLRPNDEDRKSALDRLTSYGGAFATAQSDGSFQLAIPQPESYWIVILSKNFDRDPNNKLFKSEEDTLNLYFDDVASLLGDRDFRLMNRVAKVDQPASPILCDFHRDK